MAADFVTVRAMSLFCGRFAVLSAVWGFFHVFILALGPGLLQALALDLFVNFTAWAAFV